MKLKRQRKHLIVLSNGTVIHTDHPELITSKKGWTKIRDPKAILDQKVKNKYQEGTKVTKEEILNHYEV